ncbi:MAG: diguanylate cyclase [Terracidiphilus sp.]
MPYSSIPLAVTAGLSAGIAAVATGAWIRSRRSLAESLREREELEKSSSLLEVESQIMDRMNDGATLTEVLDILTHAIEKMAPECLCSVLLLDEKQERLWEGSRGGLPEAYIRAVKGLVIGPEVGACGSAAFRNTTTIVEDISTDRRFATVKDFVMSFGLLACWSVPIRGANHRVLGTFAMYHRRRAKPRPRELGIVEAAAHLAANAIERTRATERLKENEGRIAFAEKAGSLGIWEFDVATGASTLSKELAVQFGLPDAAQTLSLEQMGALIHPDDWKLMGAQTAQAYIDRKTLRNEFRVLLSSGVTRWLRSQARIEYRNDRPYRVIGVSVDITKEKEIMEGLAFQAAHDGLTAIWNRTAILDLMLRELDSATRQGTSTGVLMLDIDHFKQVNDTYGHLAGDAVLRESAIRLQQAVRSYDLVGRYGGEEFLVVFPRCDREQLEGCAKRIRTAFDREFVVLEGAPIKITVSGGWTIVDSTVIGQQEALAVADAALYRAKRNGRNLILGQDAYDAKTEVAAQ